MLFSTPTSRDQSGMGNTQLIYFQGSQCWHRASGSEQFVKLYHTIIPSASAHISHTFGFRKWIHLGPTWYWRLKYNPRVSILRTIIESFCIKDAFPICSIVSMKSPGVPVIEQPPFYWKIIIQCSFETCKWYHGGIITHQQHNSWRGLCECCCEHGEVAWLTIEK